MREGTTSRLAWFQLCLSLGLGLALVACEDDTAGDGACETGRTRGCQCGESAFGSQACDDTGAWEVCSCAVVDAGPDEDTASSDTSVPPSDTSVPPRDTAMPPTDTAMPPDDTATPPSDTSTPPNDTAPDTSGPVSCVSNADCDATCTEPAGCICGPAPNNMRFCVPSCANQGDDCPAERCPPDADFCGCRRVMDGDLTCVPTCPNGAGDCPPGHTCEANTVCRPG